jgi:outer membrane protein assembly factor BamD
MKTIKYFILVFIIPIVASCATSPQGADAYKGQSPQLIYSQGEKALAKKHFKDAVSHFEAFDALYPFDPRAEQALLDVIYAYYKSYDPDSAIAAADRYIRLYPTSRHIAYVYYLRGVVNMERNLSWIYNAFPLDPAKRDLASMQQAFADFQKLLQICPSSDYAGDARKRMIYIRNLLARREIQVAQFYYMRRAYIAAANRASYVVQHLQGSPEVPQALKIMAKSYQALGETDLGNDALQVLKLNYPNSAAGNK